MTASLRARNELITEPHASPAHIKGLMRRCLELEASGEAVSADLMWGIYMRAS